MPKLPQFSGRELVKIFKKDGWQEISQRGSHLKLVKYFNSSVKTTVIIPQHKILKKGTLAKILKEAKFSLERLKEL